MNGYLPYRLLVGCCLLLLIACRGAPPTEELAVTPDSALALTSTAFEDGGAIPTQYTCDGADISPPLNWEDPPPSAASMALIMDDPEAPVGTWVHWVVYDLPSDLRSLPEGVRGETELASGGVQGTNSWPRIGYGGPCPPSGTHRYVFTLYALDTVLGAGPGLSKVGLLGEMEGHVLAQTQLAGTYARP